MFLLVGLRIRPSILVDRSGDNPFELERLRNHRPYPHTKEQEQICSDHLTHLVCIHQQA